MDISTIVKKILFFALTNIYFHKMFQQLVKIIESQSTLLKRLHASLDNKMHFKIRNCKKYRKGKRILTHRSECATLIWQLPYLPRCTNKFHCHLLMLLLDKDGCSLFHSQRLFLCCKYQFFINII